MTTFKEALNNLQNYIETNAWVGRPDVIKIICSKYLYWSSKWRWNNFGTPEFWSAAYNVMQQQSKKETKNENVHIITEKFDLLEALVNSNTWKGDREMVANIVKRFLYLCDYISLDRRNAFGSTEFWNDALRYDVEANAGRQQPAKSPRLTDDVSPQPAAKSPRLTDDVGSQPAAKSPRLTDDVGSQPAAKSPRLTDDVGSQPAAKSPRLTDDVEPKVDHRKRTQLSGKKPWIKAWP